MNIKYLLFLSLVIMSCLFLSTAPQESSSDDRKPFNYAGKPAQAIPDEISLLTINVWSGLNYKGVLKMGEYQNAPEKRYKLLVSEIRKISPDIIAVQEANPLPDYAVRLAADLGYQVIFHVSLGGIRLGPVGIPINLREGEAILVKNSWKFEEIGIKRLAGFGIVTNWFCFQFSEITQVILIKAFVNGRFFYIYSVHLHSGPFRGEGLDMALKQIEGGFSKKEIADAKKAMQKDIEMRRREIANLKKFIRKTLPPNAYAVIMGDFNTTQESGELDPLIANREWVDSYGLKNPGKEGATWDPLENPNFQQGGSAANAYTALKNIQEQYPARIDFILLNSAFPLERIRESAVVFTPEDGLSPSDHYGVLTRLGLH